MMKLAEHFHLSEFTASETAARWGIENTPQPLQLERLRCLARGMEHVRQVLGVAVRITSGLRVLELNTVIGGAMTRQALEIVYRETANDYVRQITMLRIRSGKFGESISQHVDGSAADCTAPAFGPPATVCRAIEASDVRFDQLIYEIDWMHISFVEDRKPRRQVLTLKGGNYVVGIVD